MTVKRPSGPKRVPRTPQEAARRRHLLDASSGELGYGGEISTPQPPWGEFRGSVAVVDSCAEQSAEVS